MIPMWCVVKEREGHALDVSAWFRNAQDGCYYQRMLCSECGEWHWRKEEKEQGRAKV